MSQLGGPPAAPEPEPPPLLELHGVSKRYGGVVALRSADLTVARGGGVHGLIGENGSGKSTLLGMLSGQVSPDAGEIRIGGCRVTFHSPADALRHGIAMVSQETSVAHDLSVAENIFLGRRMVRRWAGIDWPATHERASELMGQVGLVCSPEARVRSLRPDQRQLVEICRALASGSQVIILDEPTSSLTDDEVGFLFQSVRRLTAQGVTAIFVSHKLDELLDLSDEITVLRDGETVLHGDVSEFTVSSLVGAMVGGKHLDQPKPTPAHVPAASAAPAALQVRALSAKDALRGVDLDVGQGEVVGIAGLEGAGRSELLEALFGVRPVTSGEVRLFGEPFYARHPAAAIASGVGYVPADRKSQGLVLSMSVLDNMTMVVSGTRSRLQAPRPRAEAREGASLTAALRLRAASPQALVSSLSGGNQQKIAIGKWLAAKPRLLLLDEPTRGVDVGAKQEIHALVRGAARGGTAVLVSSSEGSELRDLCNRVVVMSRGRTVACLPVGAATDQTLARLAGGHV